jgi:hypothetical protein
MKRLCKFAFSVYATLYHPLPYDENPYNADFAMPIKHEAM